jgi:hypothetical protein
MTMTRKVALLTIILSIASFSLGKQSGKELKMKMKNKKLGRLKKNFKDEEVKLAQQEYQLAQDYEKALLKEQADLEKQKLGQKAPQAQQDLLDLNIRFSKIFFVDQNVNTSLLPLTKDDYPLDKETAMWLRTSQCPSITIPENCYECDMSFKDLIEAVGGEPTHPSRDPASPYWDELREVTRVQKQRRNNADPKEIMPIAKIWKNFTIKDVAEAVHDEYPGAVQVELIKSLMKDCVKVDNTTIPLRCNVEFLRGIVMLADLNTWAIGTVGPINFGIKYYVGRARPEEVAFLISEGKLTSEDGVPDDLLMDIPLHLLANAVNYTAYPEGSPKHPSWPAMHSAASSASFWLAVVLNMTPEYGIYGNLHVTYTSHIPGS